MGASEASAVLDRLHVFDIGNSATLHKNEIEHQQEHREREKFQASESCCSSFLLFHFCWNVLMENRKDPTIRTEHFVEQTKNALKSEEL